MNSGVKTLCKVSVCIKENNATSENFSLLDIPNNIALQLKPKLQQI